MGRNNLIQIRKGSDWSSDPVLASGEPGFDILNNTLKIGDGVSSWSQLTPIGGSGGSGGGINNIIEDMTPQLGGDLDINLNDIIGTGNINISGSITANSGNFDVVSFNVDDESVLTKGQISWDDTEGSLSIGLTDNSTIHVGEHRYFRIRNQTGSPLYKGQVVYATGVHSNGLITPAKYVADGSIREVRFMGVILEDVNHNNNGYVVDFGHLHDMDPDGSASNYAVGDETWVAGDILYVHPTVAGKLTKVEPKHSISVAIVLDPGNGNGNGRMFVRPTSYGHLDDNHDVAVSGATNGQFLQYNSTTDYWVPSSSGNFTTLQVNGTAVPTGTGIGQFLPVWNNISSLGISNIYETTSDQQGYISINDTSIASNNILGLYSPNAGDTRLYMHSTYGGAYIVQVPNDPFTPDNLWWGLSTSSTWIGSRGDFNPMEKISFYVKATGIAGNPTEKMTIGLSGTVINDLGGNYDFRVEGDNDANLLFTDASTDRVGIGTSSPSYKLHVSGTAGFSSTIDAPNIGVGVDNSVVILDSDGKLRTDEIDSRVWGSSLVDGAGTSNYIAKWNDSNTLTSGIIYDDGSVISIGGTSLGNKLHISSSNSRSYAYILASGGIGTESSLTRIDNSSNSTSDSFAGLFLSTLRAGSNVSQGAIIANVATNASTYQPNIVFAARNGGSTYAELMRIDYAGNVGMGTVSPSEKLDVSGVIKASGGNSSNWNTAYGWGNHATAGYQSAITGAASTITSNNLTTGRALISDGSGKVAVSDITSTELNYLDNVSSNIQTQINNKVSSNSAITGATKTKITYDSKGLVTSGADLTESDIPTLSQNKVTNLTTDLADRTTKTYIASRGQNLLTNGTALLGDNTNFSSFVFDGQQANSSPGSFRFAGPGTVYTDEFMPVLAEKRYKMTVDAKSLNGLGRYYMMTVAYDVDNQVISAQHHMYRANTLTTLAAPLNNGDTVVYLNSAANWYDGGTAGVSTHLRSIILWNYTNSFGYQYPPLTYSRNWTSNAWDPGSIDFVNNTITLRVPWAGGSVPSGTYLSNGSAGGSFKYNILANTLLNTTWTTYTGVMDGVDYSGTNVTSKFPPGTAKIKLGWLMNYASTGETAWFTNMVVTLDNLAYSSIYDNGTNIGIGTGSPSQKLDIRYPAGGGMALIKDSDSNDGLLFGDIAYSANNTYQGIKHAFMTSSTDYMIMSEGVNTLISSTSVGSIFLRGGSNGQTNEIRIYPDTAGVVVNEQGANSDFRVEGDADQNLLRIDASAENIGIGTSSPTEKLTLDGSLKLGTKKPDDQPFSQSAGELVILSDTNAKRAIACNGDGRKIAATFVYSSGGQKIKISEDGGKTWSEKHTGSISESFEQKGSMSVDGRVIAFCMSVIKVSIDGGETWNSYDPDSTFGDYYGITVSRDGRAIVAAHHGGKIWITLDGGSTWSSGGSASKKWNSVTITDDLQTLYAVASDVSSGPDHIYKSTNGGSTWSQISSTADHYYGVDCSSDGAYVLVGRNSNSSNNGVLLVSTNSGSSFTERNTTINGSTVDLNYRNVAVCSDGSRMVASVYGGNFPAKVYYTSDYGTTWEAASTPTNFWWDCDITKDGYKIVASTYQFVAYFNAISHDYSDDIVLDNSSQYLSTKNIGAKNILSENILAGQIISNGSVGIGTATLSEKLHVVGNVFVDRSTATTSKIDFKNFSAGFSTNATDLDYIRLYSASAAHAGMGITASNFNIGTSGLINTNIYANNNLMVRYGTSNITRHYCDQFFNTECYFVQGGSSTSPTLSVEGDSDTGFYFPSANTICASTSGLERIRINSAGNVGIGTDSPGYKLSVDGTFRAYGDAAQAKSIVLGSGTMPLTNIPIELLNKTNIDDQLSIKLRLNAQGQIVSGYAFPTADGTVGQALVTNGSGTVSWSDVSGSSSNLTRGSFVLTQTSGTFTVDGGYNVGTLDVYYNGSKLLTGTDYSATNGSSFTLTNPAVSGDIVEYLALNAQTSAVGNTILGSVSVTSEQSVFNVQNGYTAGGLAVFLNGIKLIDTIDFSATNGTSFTLTSPASSGDIVDYIAYGAVVASTNLQKTGDTMTGNLTIGNGADLIVEGDFVLSSYKEGFVNFGNTGSAKTIDISSGTIQTCILTANCVFTMPNPEAGRSFTLLLKTGTGNFTSTFTNVKWSNDSAPTITTASNKIDILTFVSDGINWYGTVTQNYSV